MNLRTLTIFIFTASLTLALYSCANKSCEEIEKDYVNLGQELEKTSDLFDASTINYFTAENCFFDKYKLDDLYNIIKDYSGDNIGMKMILAKLYIYKNDFEKAIITLNTVIAAYPKHPEALYLREKVKNLLELETVIVSSDSQLPLLKEQFESTSKELNDAITKSKKSNNVKTIALKLANVEDQMNNIKPASEEKIKKAIILRELLFPDKALNVLSGLVPKYANNKVWYEIALSFLYYDYLISESYSQPSDPIVSEIKNTMTNSGTESPPIPETLKIKGDSKIPTENSCMDYFNKIIGYLSSDESKLSSFLSEEEIKEIGSNQQNSVSKFAGLPLKNMGTYFYLFGKSIDKKLNPNMDDYYTREYASCIYVLKKDIGDGFKKIAKLSEKCDFEKFGIRESDKGPNIKIIMNEITDTTMKINLIDLFGILQKNYLNLSGWKGPYIAIPKDNPWAHDYVYYEDSTNKIFGVMSTGPNLVFDSFGKIGDKDSGYLMNFNDLN
jgi:hypothetical protein